MAGCLVTQYKLFVILINLFFWLSGAGILGVGIWVSLDRVISSFLDIVGTAGEFFRYSAYLLIAFGALMYIVGFCGCCGAIRNSKCLLGSYIFFLFLVIGGEIAAGVLMILYKTSVGNCRRVDDEFGTLLNYSIKREYDKNHDVQRAWNFVQVELKCCGTNGTEVYKDVATSSLNFPLTCCVLNNTEEALDNPLKAIVKNRIKCKEKSDEYFNGDGCKDKLKDLVSRYSIVVIVIGMVLGGIEIVGIIAAVCLCRHVDKEVDDEFGTLLNYSIKREYDKNHDVQRAWNFVQVELKCCGTNGTEVYKDVATSSLNFPLTCCVLNNTEEALDNPLKAIVKNRIKCKEKSDEYFNGDGCKDKLKDLVSRYSIVVIVIGMVLGGIEIVGIIAAVCLCRHVDKEV